MPNAQPCGRKTKKQDIVQLLKQHHEEVQNVNPEVMLAMEEAADREGLGAEPDDEEFEARHALDQLAAEEEEDDGEDQVDDSEDDASVAAAVVPVVGF